MTLKTLLRGQFAQGWGEAESARGDSSCLRTNNKALCVVQDTQGCVRCPADDKAGLCVWTNKGKAGLMVPKAGKECGVACSCISSALTNEGENGLRTLTQKLFTYECLRLVGA